MDEQVRVVVCHSGGVDSTTLLYDLAQSCEVIGFGVDYGQTHRQELEVAKSLCADLGVEYAVAEVAGGIFSGSELTDFEHGSVVVPNRNMVLIALAGALAVARGAGAVGIACHAGDHDLFPDCRPRFMEEAFKALKTACGVSLLYPYVRMSKLDVVRRGQDLGVPFERTWSCYGGEPEPCGSCLACRERREALFLAGVVAE
jgi:7-cyano-7-deazaguanine synthase